MPRTRVQLRNLVAQQFPLPFISGTSTATTATSLTDLPTFGQYPNNLFIGAHVFWTAIDIGNPDRRVTDSVQSTGVLTTIPSDSDGDMGATEGYEILPFSATSIHQAIDEALLEAYDKEWLGRQFWISHWLTGSPIYNPNWDYWDAAATVDGWTLSSGTLARVDHSSTSLPTIGENIVSFPAGAATFDLDRTYRRFLQDLKGHTITLRAWLWSDTASGIRLRLVVDGSVVGSSNSHAGDSQWELVSLESQSIASGATEIYPRIDLQNPAGTEVQYAGPIWFEGGPPVKEYPFPIGLLPNGPTGIFMSPISVDSSNAVSEVRPRNVKPAGDYSIYRYHDAAAATQIGVLVFTSYLLAGQKLWMPCEAPFTLPTADTGNVEVNSPDDLLIAKMAALKLVEKDMYKGTAATDRQRLAEFVGRLQRDIQELADTHGGNTKAVALAPRW